MTTARITFCKQVGGHLLVKGRIGFDNPSTILTGRHRIQPGVGWTCVVEKLDNHWTILRRTVTPR